MRDKECSNCAGFHVNKRAREIDGRCAGECRLKPPPSNINGEPGLFPLVWVDSWCMQWRSKNAFNEAMELIAAMDAEKDAAPTPPMEE